MFLGSGSMLEATTHGLSDSVGGDTWHNICTEATRTQELLADNPENKIT